MSPAMALIPKDGDIKKASKIYKVALLCIFLRTLRGYESGALLKYHNWKP